MSAARRHAPQVTTTDPRDDELLRLATELRVTMSRLGRRTRSFTGLTPSQLSALTTLDEAGRLRLHELAAREGVRAATMSRAVDVLEETGLVARHRDPRDARSAFIELTARGRRAVKQAADERSVKLAARLRALDPEQLSAIEHALPALRLLVESLVREE